MNLPISQLQQYALEAPYAANRPDGNLWPTGTGSESEKRILYAVAKALNTNPQVDLGTRWGAFAVQLLAGNTEAETTTVDIEGFILGTKQPTGKFIPDGMVYYKWIADCVDWLRKQGDSTIGLIVEDTAHTTAMTKAIYELAVDKLIPGGVIISHDAVHPKFKGAVLEGIRACGIEPCVYLVDGDSCGFAIWQKGGDNDVPEKEVAREIVDSYNVEWKTSQEEVTMEYLTPDEVLIDIIPPKPKRKKRKKKTVEPEAL